jgi:hypothetical protein
MPASRTDPLGVTPTRRDAAHDLAVLEAGIRKSFGQSGHPVKLGPPGAMSDTLRNKRMRAEATSAGIISIATIIGAGVAAADPKTTKMIEVKAQYAGALMVLAMIANHGAIAGDFD